MPSDKAPKFEHRYTSELCRKLILWAWTRTREQVEFTAEATTAILRHSVELAKQFSAAIPLVDKGGMRYKLARLAAALAARLFSCSEDYESIVVYECHVEYVVNFIRQMYCAPTFGYDAFSVAQEIQTELLDPQTLRSTILGMPFPKDFCRSMLAQDYIEGQDLADWSASENGTAQSLVSLFVRKHAIMRRGKYYRKTPLFIDFLKSMAGDESVPSSAQPTKERRF
jgi:hypothetical protein